MLQHTSSEVNGYNCYKHFKKYKNKEGNWWQDKNCGSTAGVLYGLPKVHKTGCPFRPIVSSVNTYNYNLASFLVNVLKPIYTNQFTIKDSFTFLDWVKAHQHNNEMMCSFDVCSLFTNVPLDETIEISLTKLYSLPDPPSLPRHVLKDLQRRKEKPLRFWWGLLRSNRWRRYGLSTRSSISKHFHV